MKERLLTSSEKKKKIKEICHFDFGSEFKINANIENAIMHLNVVSDLLQKMGEILAVIE